MRKNKTIKEVKLKVKMKAKRNHKLNSINKNQILKMNLNINNLIIIQKLLK